MIDRRVAVTPMYAGAFTSEEGLSVQADSDELAAVLRAAPADRWFALEVSVEDWRRWTLEEGGVTWWLPADEDADPATHKVFVGEAFDRAAVAALEGDHEALLWNMTTNGWERVVRTRLGNFQPVGSRDVVLTEEQLAARLATTS